MTELETLIHTTTLVLKGAETNLNSFNSYFNDLQKTIGQNGEEKDSYMQEALTENNYTRNSTNITTCDIKSLLERWDDFTAGHSFLLKNAGTKSNSSVKYKKAIK